jgi:hypothetical protein
MVVASSKYHASGLITRLQDGFTALLRLIISKLDINVTLVIIKEFLIGLVICDLA